MNHVRYKQRDCKDQEKIGAFLTNTRIGVVGMVDGDMPYTVPVNYVWHNGSIYFHGMGSGRKEDILSKGPNVSFTVYEEVGTVTDPVPCKADTAYMSVMIFGKVEKTASFDEAAGALQKILDKYMPGFYNHPMSASFVEKYRSAHDNKGVAVYKITPSDMTAKENSADESQLFHNHPHK